MMKKQLERLKNNEPKTETSSELEEDWTHTVRHIWNPKNHLGRNTRPLEYFFKSLPSVPQENSFQVLQDQRPKLD